MNREMSKRLRSKLDAVLESHFKDADFKASLGNAKFSVSNVTFQLEIAEVSESGEAMTKEAEDFQQSAHLHGLQPTDLFRTFDAGGELRKVVGLKPRSPKYPIVVECVESGQRYKYPAANVAMLLASQS